MTKRTLPWAIATACALLVAAVGLLHYQTPLLSAASTAGQAGLQTEVVLTATADATIDDLHTDVNYGSDYRLYTSYETRTTQTRRSLLQFSLGDVPSTAIIDSARLELYLMDVGTISNTIGAYLLSDLWGEGSVTWSNRPGSGATHADASIGTSTGYYYWDVLALARAWQTGRNFGLELRGPEGSGSWSYGFWSRTGEASPRLRINYHLPAATSTATPTAMPSPTRTNTTSPSATNTATRTNTPTNTPAPAVTNTATATATATATRTATPSGYVELSPIMDAWTDQNVSASATNHGADIVLRVGRVTGTPMSPSLPDAGLDAYANRWALLRFTLSLPANASITSAVLRLSAQAEAGSGADPYQISPWPLIEDWQEMTVNWANMPDFGFSPLLAVNVPATSGYVYVPLTEMVREWVVDPSANFGVMLRNDGITVGSRRFSSREGADPPVLQVNYVVDNDKPTNPTAVWADRAAGVWSTDPHIMMSWSGATDAGSGIHGYSYTWTQSIFGAPDLVEDTQGNWVNTTIPADGKNWYFAVKARDNAGNWATGSASSAAFWLDATPPTPPFSVTGIPPLGSWTTDNTVSVSWSGATDPGAGSGIYGYALEWSLYDDTVPDELVNVVGATTNTSSPLTNGAHYVHLRTRDVAGNWSVQTRHAGPWLIDTQAPHSHALAGDGSTQTLVNQTQFPVTWTGTDAGSGIAFYDIQYRDDTDKTPWQNWLLTIPANSPAQAEFYGAGGHIYCFRSRAVDHVGLAEAYQDDADGCVALAYDDIHVLQPFAIEVTQAVQDLANSINLVRGKRTFVRCHVKSDIYAWDNVEAELLLYYKGGYLTTLTPLNPGGKITVLPNPDRASLWSSYYFEVPQYYTSGDEMSFRCLVDPGQEFADLNPANNIAETTVQFHNTYALRYAVYQILIEGSGPSWQTLDDAASMVRNMYPIPLLDVEYRWYSNSGYEWDDLPSAQGLLSDLSSKHDENIDEGDDLPSTIYFGMIQAWDDDAGGLGYLPGRTAVGLSDGIIHAPHELGHNLYQWHVAGCGNPKKTNPNYPFPGGRISPTLDPADPYTVYGFDPNPQGWSFPRVYGPETGDLMSYCGDRWISAYTWWWLSNILAAGPPADQAAPAEQLSASGDYLMVRAEVISATNTITLGNFYRVTNTTTNPLPCTPGDYTIRLLGASGATLAEHSCAANGTGDDETTAALAAMIPWVSGTQQIAILRGQGAGATLLATRNVSANAPTVTLLTPNGGETLSGESVTVRWAAGDADGDPLTFTLDYSRDAGASWETMQTNISGTQVTVPLSTLPGGDQSLLRVSANDGVNRSRDSSDAVFAVADKQPLLRIREPQTGRRYSFGQLVSLRGSAYDMEDGDLSAAMQWTSSISGTLGNGMVQVSDLVTGTHVITLTITDTAGQRTTETTTILVGYDRTISLPVVVK